MIAMIFTSALAGCIEQIEETNDAMSSENIEGSENNSTIELSSIESDDQDREDNSSDDGADDDTDRETVLMTILRRDRP